MLDLAVPRQIDIAQSPCVLKGRSGGLRAYRRGVVCIRVKRRIQVDQVSTDSEFIPRMTGRLSPVQMV